VTINHPSGVWCSPMPTTVWRSFPSSIYLPLVPPSFHRPHFSVSPHPPMQEYDQQVFFVSSSVTLFLLGLHAPHPRRVTIDSNCLAFHFFVHGSSYPARHLPPRLPVPRRHLFSPSYFFFSAGLNTALKEAGTPPRAWIRIN